jgi:AAA15 family ATPase/GTPase
MEHYDLADLVGLSTGIELKNLNGVEVDFDENQLMTVVIGENGTGKSNLIEALVRIVSDIDRYSAGRVGCSGVSSDISLRPR